MADLGQAVVVALLLRERAVTLELIERLPAAAKTLPGIGGGEWSAKNLLGHLESWEEHLLNAFSAWAHHQPPPILVSLSSEGLDAINARESAQRARRGYDEQLASTLATRQRLIETLEALDDRQWYAPPDSGSERTMADLAGGLLGSDAGPFTHDAAHHAELRAFVEEHGSPP